MEERELEEVLSLCTVSGEKELGEVLSLCMIIGGERARRSLHTHFSKGAEKKGRIAQLVDQTEKGRHGWYHHRFDSLV